MMRDRKEGRREKRKGREGKRKTRTQWQGI
jgi:hypothetical protein